MRRLEEDALARLVAWGKADDAVRALILTSSRARADGSADALSDYDVVVVVPDAAVFAGGDGWTRAYGRPLVRWGDADELYGSTTYFRSVVYDDGTRVDYTIWPENVAERVAEESSPPESLDVGYRVLLDKDGRTSGWRPPTYRAHVPTRPTRSEYDALTDEFWWNARDVAKGWRGEVFFAKFMLDYDLKFVAFPRLLEWRVEIDHDWTLRPGSHGRGLERLLPADIWSELARTYVGADLEDNWDALFRTTALFRRVATAVGDALGYPYARHVDGAMTAHLKELQALSQQRRASS